MTIFDLVFLAAALASIVTILCILALLVRRRWFSAARLAIGWAACVVVYVVVGLAISYVRPQKLVRIGEAWCFDDWCMQVDQAGRSANSTNYDVQLHIFSRALRVSQRAKGAWIYLVDDRGRRYAPEFDASAEPLDSLLGPGQSIGARREFKLPPDARVVGLITGHGGGYCGAMTLFVMGDGGCWFGKPAMVRLD